MLPLGLLSNGETGEIVACKEAQPAPDGDRGGRAEDMGLRVGKRVEMLANGSGLVLVKVDESRIAIARSIAMKIVVRR